MLGDSGTIALIWSEHSQSWLFPKGTIEEGETYEEAARREIAEETGLADLEYLDDLGEFERAYPASSGWGVKRIHMFLFSAQPHAVLAPTLEVEKAQWVSLARVMEVLGKGENATWFEADRAWFTRVFERVRQAVQRD